MGDMHPETYDVLYVAEHAESRAGNALFVGMSRDEAAESADRLFERGTEKPHNLRVWLGEVFYDHVRGEVGERPDPAERPFLLVWSHAYHDWNASGSSHVKLFDSADALIAEASAMVAEERSHGFGVSELWEVYAVSPTRTFERAR